MWYEWVNTAQSCTTFTRAPLHAFLLLPYHSTQSTSHPTQFCPHSAPPAPLLRPAPPLSPPRYHFDKEIAMLRKLKRKAMMWEGAFDAGVQLTNHQDVVTIQTWKPGSLRRVIEAGGFQDERCLPSLIRLCCLSRYINLVFVLPHLITHCSLSRILEYVCCCHIIDLPTVLI